MWNPSTDDFTNTCMRTTERMKYDKDTKKKNKRRVNTESSTEGTKIRMDAQLELWLAVSPWQLLPDSMDELPITNLT